MHRVSLLSFILSPQTASRLTGYSIREPPHHSHFDNAGPFEIVVPRSSVRRADTESCARFDALMAAEPLVTRRIRLDPRSSVVSPVEVDIH